MIKQGLTNVKDSLDVMQLELFIGKTFPIPSWVVVESRISFDCVNIVYIISWSVPSNPDDTNLRYFFKTNLQKKDYFKGFHIGKES